jgi:hypothetical protein
LRQKDQAKQKSHGSIPTVAAKKEEDLLSDFFASLPPDPLPSVTPVSDVLPPAHVSSELPLDPSAPSPPPPPSFGEEVASSTPPTATANDEAGSPVADLDTDAAEEDILAGFFSELTEASKVKEEKREIEANVTQASLLTEKYTNQVREFNSRS